MEKENKPQEVLKICKVCQQGDWFNPTTGYCLRCSKPAKEENFSIRKFRPEIAKPEGVEVEKLGDSLVLKKGWYDRELASFQFPFTVGWNTFLMIFLALWISDQQAKGGFSNIDTLAFLSPFILVGVISAYYLLTTYLNYTTICVTKDSLSVKHRPLFWLGNRTIPKSELEQLYVVKGSTIKSGGKKTHYYDLKAKLKNGGHHTLISSLPSTEVALFLEQQIEKYVGITDYVVEGEIS